MPSWPKCSISCNGSHACPIGCSNCACSWICCTNRLGPALLPRTPLRGGHRPGTGRLGAEAYVGAARVECRHENLAVGQRCPVCGQGTLYALPAGVEVRIDGQALLSAIRYALEKVRCSACGQIFTAGLPGRAGA